LGEKHGNFYGARETTQKINVTNDAAFTSLIQLDNFFFITDLSFAEGRIMFRRLAEVKHSCEENMQNYVELRSKQ
jgi:hypothetical protein